MIEKKTIVVKIPHDSSTELERLLYESKSCKETLEFLNSIGAEKSLLNDWAKTLMTVQTKLNLMKDQIHVNFCPEEFKGILYNWSYDYKTGTITYTESEV